MEDNAPLKTLKASDIANMPCDIYKCASSKTPCYTGPISFWLDSCSTRFAAPVYELRKLPYDSPEQKYYKSNNIKAATLSCTCGKKPRCKGNVEHVNPLIVIDIDYKPEKNENVFLADRAEKLKKMNELIDSGFAYAVGSSCRGTGMWAIIPLASTDIELHFNALIDHFAKQNIILDPSCRDVTRLRFASPDDIIRTRYTTLNCYQDKKEGEKEQPEKKVKPYSNKPDFALKYDKERYSIPEIIDDLLSLGFATDTYEEWLQACFHLLPLGEEGFELFVKISQSSGNFRGVNDCRNKWNQNLGPNPRSRTVDGCFKYWKYILEHFQSPQNQQNLTQR